MRKRKSVVAGSLLLSCVLSFQIPASAEWQKPLQPSFSGGALTCLAVHPLDPKKFLLASEHDIFERKNENAWQTLWSQAGTDTPFRRLFSFPYLPDFIFALSNDKIFMGDLQDHSWRAVYQDPSRVPLAFAVHPKDPDRWLVGTDRGLLETEDGGKTWSPSPLFRGSNPVPLVLFEKERVFLATDNALFVSSGDTAARQIFTLPRTEKDPLEAETDGPSEESASYLFKIQDLLITQNDSSGLFLGTRNGVFQSLDHGYRWEPLPQSGLQNPSVLQLASSTKGDRLYAATPQGVYSYDFRAHRWTGLFEGLARDGARSIAVQNDEKLLAITEEGFAQYPLAPFVPEAGPGLTIYRPAREKLLLLEELISLEPSAREIHKRVIRYADVANGKIKRWHTLSRLAGALPNFSFGKNLDRNASVSTYGGKFITGPEDISKGWDADVSWDFGDILYSSNQTSIDSREKMMVELRNNLLSEATRIYYERRRLQIDLLFAPPSTEQEHLENLLRVDELTTLLDGMTNGYFSKQLERIYNENPAFKMLWSFDLEGVRGTAYGEKQKEGEV